MKAEAGRGGGEAVRTRDHFANTRTLLSWFRSGLLLLAMGFAVTKFHALASGSLVAARLGPAIAAMGLLVIAASLVRFLHHRRDIERSEFRPRTAFDVLLLASAAAAGAAVLYLVAR